MNLTSDKRFQLAFYVYHAKYITSILCNNDVFRAKQSVFPIVHVQLILHSDKSIFTNTYLMDKLLFIITL